MEWALVVCWLDYDFPTIRCKHDKWEGIPQKKIKNSADNEQESPDKVKRSSINNHIVSMIQ